MFPTEPIYPHPFKEKNSLYERLNSLEIETKQAYDYQYLNHSRFITDLMFENRHLRSLLDEQRIKTTQLDKNVRLLRENIIMINEQINNLQMTNLQNSSKQQKDSAPIVIEESIIEPHIILNSLKRKANDDVNTNVNTNVKMREISMDFFSIDESDIGLVHTLIGGNREYFVNFSKLLFHVFDNHKEIAQRHVWNFEKTTHKVYGRIFSFDPQTKKSIGTNSKRILLTRKGVIKFLEEIQTNYFKQLNKNSETLKKLENFTDELFDF